MQHRTEQPGATLTPVRFPGAARDHSINVSSYVGSHKGFFSQSHISARTLLRCPYRAPSAMACTSICTRVRVEKYQTLAAIPLFEHTEILHTLVGMGRAALTSSVARASQIEIYI